MGVDGAEQTDGDARGTCKVPAEESVCTDKIVLCADNHSKSQGYGRSAAFPFPTSAHAACFSKRQPYLNYLRSTSLSNPLMVVMVTSNRLLPEYSVVVAVCALILGGPLTLMLSTREAMTVC